MHIIDPMQNNLPFPWIETIEKLKVIQNLPANLFFFLNKQIDFCILGAIHKFHSNFLTVPPPTVIYTQFPKMNTATLENKPYVNEVTLKGQNLPLKYWYPVELLSQFGKGFDLSMLEIWGL